MHNKLIPVLILITGLFASCKNEKQKLTESISEKEKELMSDTLKSIDPSKAREMINLYKDYADKFAHDSVSNEYLFKAADISNGIGEHREAIALYKQVAASPDFSKKAVALFLQGFIYENALKDYFQARTIYEEFIQKYPDHPLTDDVKYSLQNLGKTPEELVKAFENNKSITDSLAVK